MIYLSETKPFNWDVVEKEIRHNKIKRFNWRLYFGHSLTHVIAKLREQGLTAEETYWELIKTHPKLNEDLRRRLKIGVCARYGEMGTVEKVQRSK